MQQRNAGSPPADTEQTHKPKQNYSGGAVTLNEVPATVTPVELQNLPVLKVTCRGSVDHSLEPSAAQDGMPTHDAADRAHVTRSRVTRPSGRPPTRPGYQSPPGESDPPGSPRQVSHLSRGQSSRSVFGPAKCGGSSDCRRGRECRRRVREERPRRDPPPRMVGRMGGGGYLVGAETDRPRDRHGALRQVVGRRGPGARARRVPATRRRLASAPCGRPDVHAARSERTRRGQRRSWPGPGEHHGGDHGGRRGVQGR